MDFKDNKIGFTLIELLVVLIIASILSAIAYPTMATSIASNRVRAQGETILNLLIFARSEAISRGRNITITPINNWQGGADVTVTVGAAIQTLKHIPNFTGNTIITPNTKLTVTPRGLYVGGAISVRHGKTDLRTSISFNSGSASLSSDRCDTACTGQPTANNSETPSKSLNNDDMTT
ncbi:hypothetical protein ACH42_16035 [Endozoicomonas sp. (ex Bugula neritina AB1)]|nr:hypothetical protein ACH42_16035 [Endozoicomonas sp. (ex Bugula neritina AB1)]